MDVADEANEHIEREMQARMATHRGQELAPTGACLFCDEPLAHPLRFCDTSCRDGHDALQRARSRNGVGAAGTG